MTENMRADTIEIVGHNGDKVEAYRVAPDAPDTRGGVVVIHHAPGWDRGTMEAARRFASLGYDVVAPNLYSRIAPPGTDPHAASELARAQGGPPDEQVVGDLNAAAEHLRGLSTSNGRVAVGGYCAGGRQALLAALDGRFDAAIDCYGNSVTGGQYMGRDVEPLNERLAGLPTPVLGLFGNQDKNPNMAAVDELEEILKSGGTDYEFHRYEDAGHAFFNPDGRGFVKEAALDGWKRIEAFLAKHLRA